MKKIKVVTICGSMKNKKEMIIISQKLELEKNYAVIQCIYFPINKKLTKKELELLDKIHRKKIDISDAIYVVNINGYIGTSCRSEIEYAIKQKKEIIYHEIDK